MNGSRRSTERALSDLAAWIRRRFARAAEPQLWNRLDHASPTRFKGFEQAVGPGELSFVIPTLEAEGTGPVDLLLQDEVQNRSALLAGVSLQR